ncbi:Casein kinase I-like protein 1 [Hypsibius exemplaris]|uniref:Casein kinase I-like protein 1 n=1 Tax=Hypsibius exemplaris TaxID=2072580 RepID=A0A1W0XEA8_HYPEX|nr:Casein kinase I-like protein 1 [Hypsibius exemplaris]
MAPPLPKLPAIGLTATGQRQPCCGQRQPCCGQRQPCCGQRQPCCGPRQLTDLSTQVNNHQNTVVVNIAEKSSEEPPTVDHLLGSYIGRMYLIGHIIGKGSFGTIRLCNPGRPKHFVVVKVEQRREGKRSRLYDEFNILRDINGAMGFPKVYYFTVLPSQNVMVLDMLGPTLEELMLRVGGVFSVRTVALIGLQLMDRMEFLHKNGILYRDTKGENLLIGLFDHHNRIYLVDFGLCKRVMKEDGNHYTPVGTPRYMSLRTHDGRAASYRDDVESVGYLLVYFALGRLPWQGLPAASTDTKISMIRDRKNTTSLPELCAGLPVQLMEYLQSARNLRFNEFPNYHYFRGLLRGVLRSCACEAGDRHTFDWQKPGIKLTVLPKVNQPTAISQKHEVFEQSVVDLRQSGGRDGASVRRGPKTRPRNTSTEQFVSAKGSVSYGSVPKILNGRRQQHP